MNVSQMSQMMSPTRLLAKVSGLLGSPDAKPKDAKTHGSKAGGGEPDRGAAAVAAAPKKRKRRRKPKYPPGMQPPPKPVRARTAYILYCNSIRRDLAAQRPGLKPTEMTTLLAERWKAATAQDKESSIAGAAEDRKRYEREMVGYKEKKAAFDAEVGPALAKLAASERGDAAQASRPGVISLSAILRRMKPHITSHCQDPAGTLDRLRAQATADWAAVRGAAGQYLFRDGKNADYKAFLVAVFGFPVAKAMYKTG